MTSDSAGPQSAGAARDDGLAALAAKAEEAERFLKTLANGHRLMILCELQGAELCVMDLQNAVGLSQSALSQHLARLRKDRMVTTRRDSRSIYYSLSDERLKPMIQLLSDIFCPARP